jgi:sporulation protein YlmC with PRC-barrel domain
MSEEVHVELLVGRRVVDANGRKVGHIEEMVAEEKGDELVVTEFHVGTYGFFERLSIYHFGVGFLRMFGARGGVAKPRKIPWQKLDLSDPEHPRLTCSIDELQ